MGDNNKKNKKESTPGKVILSILGTIVCIILAVILVINCTLIVKSYTNKDKVPDFAGHRPFIVLTGSMEPVIMGGDLIITKEVDPSQIKKGDIISFTDPDGNGVTVVTHRVIEIINDENGLSFKTKGDANNVEDKSPVPAKNVQGLYQTRLPGIGKVFMFMQTTAGLVVCVIVPLLLFIGYDLIKRKKDEKKTKDDNEELKAELERLKAEKAELEASKEAKEENKDNKDNKETKEE